ncbi:hypothetical protein CPB86DRAFT_812874 [Serendipita vermifera]|nr:hypothetical protein CPB86DRAFT_812874 [Serendipita vermifera]
MARTEANNALLSIDEYAADFLMTRHLGRSYGFPQIIRTLAKHGFTRPMMEEGEHPILDFFHRSLDIAISHVDRELKYKARIPVPTGIALVGVADLHGKLEEGCVYICTQKTDEPLKWFPQGIEADKPAKVYVTRSPSIHPGDVQSFWACYPPEGSIYRDHPMTNTIVFSCKGYRPPASMLGGGDLDGDLFQIIPEAEDFKPDIDTPAAYESVKPKELDRPARIEDIADFFVEYINSDKMGLVSIQHLIICTVLIRLETVDFAKTGIPVHFQDLPKRYFKYTPDFQHKETVLDDQTNYYESPKALGVLFRRIKVKALPEIRPSAHQIPTAEHPLFILLLDKCKEKNHLKPGEAGKQADYVIKIFHQYARELKAIRQIYTLGHSPLSEEEVFMGTILEQLSQTKMRDEMCVRLREVSGQLIDQIRWAFEGYQDEPLMPWLARAFYAFQYALSPGAGKNSRGDFVPEWKEAQCSFGMIALRSAFECLDVCNKRRPDSRRDRGHRN